VPVARAALAGGAAMLAVARPEEALELVDDATLVVASTRTPPPILLLATCPRDAVAELVARPHVELTVWTPEHVDRIAAAARARNVCTRVHVKIDSGMGRVGLRSIEQLRSTLDAIDRASGHVSIAGVFTHFARADELDSSEAMATCADQEATFARLCADEASRLRGARVHACNSAGALYRSQSHHNLVRLGVSPRESVRQSVSLSVSLSIHHSPSRALAQIAMYGLSPSSSRECPLLDGIEAALQWHTQVGDVKWLPPSAGVSYGHRFRVSATTGALLVATLPIGYADGFRRVDGAHVLIGGVRRRVVGRVCSERQAI
jgi:alanine racemase